MKISDFLPSREQKALKRMGIETVEQLKEGYPDKLQQIRGLGLKSMRSIENALFPGEEDKHTLTAPRRTGPTPPRMEQCPRSFALAKFLKELPSNNYDGLE